MPVDEHFEQRTVRNAIAGNGFDQLPPPVRFALKNVTSSFRFRCETSVIASNVALPWTRPP